MNTKVIFALFSILLVVVFSACTYRKGNFAARAEKMLPAQYATAEKFSVAVKFKNSLGMELILIPAGKFMMGASPNLKGAAFDEMPKHSVRITRPFYMGSCEVTQEQYKKLMGKAPAPEHQLKSSRGPNYPAEFISWRNAEKFCRILSKQEGRKYRLPTEAEWEYACRAGSTTVFHFGDTISTDQANFDGNRPYGNTKRGICRRKSTEVGSFPPNAFGLYDMHGNVAEWCSDYYSRSYYISSPEVDPKNTERSSYGKVARGGSWFFGASQCRSSVRDRFYSADRFYYFYGFRVVCELKPEKLSKLKTGQLGK